MMNVTALIGAVPGLNEDDLSRWLAADFIRPQRQEDQVVFTDTDIARIRLIVDLRAMLEVEERTLPLVLSLLDQLYATRWRLRQALSEMK